MLVSGFLAHLGFGVWALQGCSACTASAFKEQSFKGLGRTGSQCLGLARFGLSAPKSLNPFRV